MAQTISLDQTKTADHLVSAMNALVTLREEILHYQMPKDSPIRDHYIQNQGQAAMAADVASKAIFSFLLTVRHTQSHGAFGRYTLRVDGARESEERETEDLV